MDKKKILLRCVGIFCVLLVVIVVILVCFRKENNSDVVVEKPLNEKVSLEAVFAEIEMIEGMTGLEEELPEEADKESMQERRIDEEEIDFGKYDVLEKKALVHTTDDSVNEVWMIKLGSYEQQEDVCRILGNRLKKLKAGFEDDKEQMAVLNQAVIKQEDGIVIMIVSPYFREIQETVAEAMSN